jgi:hypothetical protein
MANANFNAEGMMAQLYLGPALSAMMLANDPPPAMMPMTREPKKVKCPNCMTEHVYCPAPHPSTGVVVPRMQDRYSHNARAVFYSGSCPICLEDPIEPPMVVFAWGHLVCVNDFKKLGGRVGADAMKTAAQVLDEEREQKTRRELPNGSGVQGLTMVDGISALISPALPMRMRIIPTSDPDLVVRGRAMDRGLDADDSGDDESDADADLDSDADTSSDDRSMPGLTIPSGA